MKYDTQNSSLSRMKPFLGSLSENFWEYFFLNQIRWEFSIPKISLRLIFKLNIIKIS